MRAYLPIQVFFWWIMRKLGWQEPNMTTTTEMPIITTAGPMPTKIPITTILPELPSLPPDEEIPEIFSEIIESSTDEKVPIELDDPVSVEKIMQMYEEETGKKAPRNLMARHHHTEPPSEQHEHEYEYDIHLEQNTNNNSNILLTQILNIIRQKNN